MQNADAIDPSGILQKLMLYELPTLLVVILAGVAIGVPAYRRLLRILRERHEALYDELGQPTMMMASPSRSQRLQKFLYSKRALSTGDSELTSTVRFLRVFTVLLIISVMVIIALALLSALQIVSPR